MRSEVLQRADAHRQARAEMAGKRAQRWQGTGEVMR
jgi:hypothetical protein